MRTKVGTFRHSITVLAEDGSAEEVEAWVDTGGLYSQFPSGMLRRLGYQPDATRVFGLADGRSVEASIGDVRVRLGDEVRTVTCVFGEGNDEMLIGATTLEVFSLSVDPVHKTLIPVVAMRLTMAPADHLEEGSMLRLDFTKLAQVAEIPGVLPCAVQNVDTQEVVLVAYVNEQALHKSIETRSAVFWSTSRNELWEKGATSGETFDLLEVRVNCEQNSLLYRVRPRKGGICHTKNAAGEPRDCFYRRIDFGTMRLENLDP
jgi:phosphoribosyl-AMP cyclohydrolase